jgi:hypothetical protein
LTHRPWASVFQLTGSDGQARYLKKVRPLPFPATVAAIEVAKKYPKQTPELVAHHADQGLMMYADHGGRVLGPNATRQEKLLLLQTYGTLQADHIRAEQDTELSTVSPATVVDQFLDFMSGNSGAPASATFLLGPERAHRYGGRVTQIAPYLRKLAKQAEALPQTIEHMDLRPQNAAICDDNSIVIFDWDEAIIGPAGMSPHVFFRGVKRIWDAARGSEATKYFSRDQAYLNAYLDLLCKNGAISKANATKAIHASAAVGVMHALTAYGDYQLDKPKYKESIAAIITKRVRDLIELVETITKQSRSPAIVGKIDWLKLAEPDNAFPKIVISDAETKNGKPFDHTIIAGAKLFQKYGVLMVENAIDPDTIDTLHTKFIAQFDDRLSEADAGGALRVGDKRYMVTLDFVAPFNGQNVITNPFAGPLMDKILGEKHILGSFTAVASLPGSKDQHTHKDHPALFPESGLVATPSFAVTMIVPTVALSKVNGATRVVKGSHLKPRNEAETMPIQEVDVPKGSIFFMDYRLTHQGAANNSDAVRPILSYVYHRPWFRDFVNYRNQAPLNLTDATWTDIPKANHGLIVWVRQG